MKKHTVYYGALCGILISFMFSGCSDFKSHPIERADTMKGPGLFTGPEGEYLLPLPGDSNTE